MIQIPKSRKEKQASGEMTDKDLTYSSWTCVIPRLPLASLYHYKISSLASMSWWSDPTSKHAFMISWIGVLLEGTAAVVGLIYWGATGSALILVFGLENIVDFMSSVVVLWRFYCPGELTQEREALLRKREKRASMAISFIMILLGITVIAAAADDLSGGPEEVSQMKTIIVLSFFSIVVFGAITVVKLQFANKLDSASLYKDAVCSLIGTVLACGVFVTTFIVHRSPSAWWLDPIFAICCGFAALFLGAYAIYDAAFVEGIPIFKSQWWFVSQGDVTDEMGEESNFGGTTVEMADSEDKTKLSEVV